MNTLQISIVAEPTPRAGGPKITEASSAAKMFDTVRDINQEAFVVASLDGQNKVIGNPRVITLGLLNSNQVHPREVFAPALMDRAASIIVAHNHPSGTLEASPEDVALTDRLARAGKLLGIPLLDHIIMTRDSHLSMKQAGYL